MQPVFALIENTSPLSLATNKRPPTTVGCERAEVTPGSPNAHFSFSCGTSGAVRRPLSAGTYRVFVTVPPKPFQFAPLPGSAIGGAGDVQRPTFESGGAVPNARPARNSATALFSASLSSLAWRNMLPVVSAVTIASGENCPSVSRLGARESAAGFAWHVAQVFWYTAAPVRRLRRRGSTRTGDDDRRNTHS